MLDAGQPRFSVSLTFCEDAVFCCAEAFCWAVSCVSSVRVRACFVSFSKGLVIVASCVTDHRHYTFALLRVVRLRSLAARFLLGRSRAGGFLLG